MSISTSTHLGLTLPGSTVNDTRLGDIQAVKSALITVDSAIANVIASNANIGGNLAINFAAKDSVVAGNIMPNVTGVSDIGSPTKRFKGIYVDEAHLSVNTLYLGDTAIMGTENSTINIKADRDQSILVKTTGTGLSSMSSETGVNIQTTGMNGDVVVQATGIGSKVRLSGAQSVDVTAPEITSYGNHTVSGNNTVGGNLVVTGSLTVNGAVTTVNSTSVSTKDNIIELNKGQVGSGVSAGKAGLVIDRGDEADYQMVFDETDDMFKVGMIGQLQTIASQNYVQDYAATKIHAHNVATTNAPGFMSAADKIKLDSSAVADNVYTQAQVNALISSAVTTLKSQMYSHG